MLAAVDDAGAGLGRGRGEPGPRPVHPNARSPRPHLGAFPCHYVMAPYTPTQGARGRHGRRGQWWPHASPWCRRHGLAVIRGDSEARDARRAGLGTRGRSRFGGVWLGMLHDA